MNRLVGGPLLVGGMGPCDIYISDADDLQLRIQPLHLRHALLCWKPTYRRHNYSPIRKLQSCAAAQF